MKRWGSLLAFLFLVILVSWWGSRFMPGEWYAGLTKPDWNPPSWLFGPVWATLYVLMAVAAWQVWNSNHPRRLLAISLWIVQLVFNGAWSWLFFGLHRPGIAMFELAGLIGLVIVTTWTFYTIRPAAAGLMLPYLAWITFALILNVTLWQLNGGGLATLLGG
jgi:tryptophan-rich sensory protein